MSESTDGGDDQISTKAKLAFTSFILLAIICGFGCIVGGMILLFLSSFDQKNFVSFCVLSVGFLIIIGLPMLACWLFEVTFSCGKKGLNFKVWKTEDKNRERSSATVRKYLPDASTTPPSQEDTEVAFDNFAYEDIGYTYRIRHVDGR